MKLVCLLSICLQLTTLAVVMGQHRQASFIAQKVIRSGTLRLAGSVAQVMPLFDPINERKWLPHWEIIIIHQDQPGTVSPGMVFRTDYDDRDRIWTLLEMDQSRGLIKYHYLYTDHYIAQIELLFNSIDDEQTEVTITYTLIAITENGNEKVNEVTAEKMALTVVAWEHAINQYLDKG